MPELMSPVIIRSEVWLIKDTCKREQGMTRWSICVFVRWYNSVLYNGIEPSRLQGSQ